MIKLFVSKVTRQLQKRKHSRFVTANSLHYPDGIPTHLTAHEKQKLFMLAREKGHIMVEIGSYVGASSCFLAAALQKPGSTLYCVDTWGNDAMSEGNRDTYAEFVSNTHAFRNLIVPLRGRSTDVAKSFNQKIDLLFIDGDHSYEGVKSDWESWSPLLNEKAIVIFHDVGWAEGVQRLIKESVAPISSKVGRLPNLYWATILGV